MTIDPFRCVEEFMVDGPGQTKKPTKAMQSYIHAKKCRNQAGSGKFKIAKDHKYSVLIRGFLGKLPKSEDINATVGEHYDLMSAFQTYFLYEGEIFQLTTYSKPIENLKKAKTSDIDCFLVMGNENLYRSRKDCHEFLEYFTKETKLKKVLMLTNASDKAGEEAWKNQFEQDREHTEKNKGAVKALREAFQKRGVHIIDVKEFSNYVIAEIFHYILRVCRGDAKKKK